MPQQNEAVRYQALVRFALDQWLQHVVKDGTGHCRDGKGQCQERQHDDYVPIAQVTYLAVVQGVVLAK